MSFRLSLTDEAHNDLQKILHWFQANTEDADVRFMQDLDYLFDKLREDPGCYGIIRKQAKVATLRNFPHAVYFHVIEDTVSVFAIQHGRRSDRHWKRRLK